MQDMMEVNGKTFHNYEKRPSENSSPATIQKKPLEKISSHPEVIGKTSRSNEKRPPENSNPTIIQIKPSDNNSCTSMFINNAAIAWNESRKKWIGNVPQRSERTPRDPIISWSTTYDDLLSTHEPFCEPIPLSEMVDFLVDIWHDEGLFD